ncbi:MAG: hypothetical protein JXO44_13360 [Clostridia bacterium]|nr:hypothetical protein [Clostridia bacterium]
MNWQLKYPDYLLIPSTDSKTHFFGGNQSWFSRYWQKEAGCGPTCAATILSYLSRSKPEFENLYQYDHYNRKAFIKHMDQVYRYVTPGIWGIHKTHVFINGVLDYAASLGFHLIVHSLILHPKTLNERSTDTLLSFVEEAFNCDSPIAFLNLDVGEAKRLQPWHWITITRVYLEDGQVMADASDEGVKRTFNLGLWYLTAKKHGGLIYFS